MPHMICRHRVDDPAAALAFTETPEAAETGADAGAVGEMEVWFLENAP